MTIKKIEFLIPDLIPNHIKDNYDVFLDLMKLFGRYLDDNNYGKILNIEDNLYAYTIYSELLDLFLDEFINETFDFDIINLTDDNKKRFIDLASIISSTKGTGEGFLIFFQLFENLSLATESGTTTISDFGTIIFSEPTEILEYDLDVSTTSYAGYSELISSIHPAGILFNVIGARYDATYLYDGTIYYSGELV